MDSHELGKPGSSQGVGGCGVFFSWHFLPPRFLDSAHFGANALFCEGPRALEEYKALSLRYIPSLVINTIIRY